MTGLLVLLTVLCLVLAVWDTALTYLYHRQTQTLEAYEEFSNGVKALCKKLVASLGSIEAKYKATETEVEEFTKYIIDEFDMYKVEISNEKKLAIQIKQDADAVMAAYRASIVDAASKQRIVTKEDGTRVIEAVSDIKEIKEEKNNAQADDHS